MNIGPYSVVGMVGRGGMGIVYKATDPSHNRTVAIKMILGSSALNQEGRMGLVREAHSAGSLHHSNIVEIYDIGQHKGWLYLVMEYLHGAPLSKVIAAGGNQSVDLKLKILIELCNALDHAHANGVVHRDVKPGNIFLTRERTVKVVDFGLAMRSGDREDKRLRGTLPYMSPEVLKGAKPDPSSDLWSVGITMYELLAGRVPFAGPNLLHDIVYAAFPPLDASLPLAEDLNRVVARALSKDKTARYESARSFASDLLHLKSAFEMSSSPTVEVTEITIVEPNTRDRELPTNSEASSAKPENGNHAQQQTAGYLRGLDLRLCCNASGPIAISTGTFRLRGHLRTLGGLLLESLSLGFLVLSLLVFSTVMTVIPWILGRWVAFSAFLSVSLAVALGAKIIEIGLRAPRCNGCHLSMLHCSRWTRFVQTQAEVVMGYRDCVAALQEGLWQDAAKLLTVHGSETTSFTGSLVISTPLADYAATKRLG